MGRSGFGSRMWGGVRRGDESRGVGDDGMGKQSRNCGERRAVMNRTEWVEGMEWGLEVVGEGERVKK